MKPIYTTIPVGLCEYALKNTRVNHLKLYVYLKHISDGYVPYDPSLFKLWDTDIGRSKRWIYEGLNWLIKNKWITVNSKRNSLHIVSYEIICKRLDVFHKVAALYEPDDFKSLDAFCAATAIVFYMRRKAWMDKKRRPVSKMGDTNTNRKSYPKGFYTLPVRYFSKCLNVSDSTANNFKQKAIKGKLIEVQRQIITQTDDKGEKLSKDKILVYREVDAPNNGSLRRGTKHLKAVEADLIKSHLIIKRKRFKHDAKK